MSTEISKEMNPSRDDFAAMLAESLAKDDLFEGSVVKVRVDQIHKGDGALEAAADAVLYTQDPFLALEKGTSSSY